MLQQESQNWLVAKDGPASAISSSSLGLNINFWTHRKTYLLDERSSGDVFEINIPPMIYENLVHIC